MKARRILVTLLAAVTFVSVSSVAVYKNNSTVNAEAIEVSDLRLDDETVEQLCSERYIASSLVYAVREAGYTVDERSLITKLGEYAELAGTDEEVDVVDAMAEILECSEDDALNVVEISDKIQEDNE